MNPNKDAFENWEEVIKKGSYTKGCRAIAKYLHHFLRENSLMFDEGNRDNFLSAIEYLFKVDNTCMLLETKADEDPFIIAQMAIGDARAELMKMEGYEFPKPDEGYPFIDMSKYQ